MGENTPFRPPLPIEKGSVYFEAVEGFWAIYKSGVYIGDLFQGLETETYYLELMTGYMLPNLETLVELSTNLPEAKKVAKEIINNIDDPELRITTYGTVQ